MRLYDVYGPTWEQHNGKVVTLDDGTRAKIVVSTINATYPYPAKLISVDAVPVCKTSKRYLTTKRELGDDWMTDVLESSIELQAQILSQLQAAR